MLPRGNKHFPDISTANKRRKQFAPADKRWVPREEILIRHHNDPKKRGSNVKIYKQLMLALPRIERMWAYKKRSPEETLLALAMYTNRKACEYADHGLLGIKTPQKLSEKEINFIGINDSGFLKTMKIDPTDPHKEKRAWEYYFNGFLDCFSKDPKIKNRQQIFDRVVEIERYTGLSEKLYRLRTKHGTKIGKFVNRLIGQKQNPEENLMAEIKRVVSRPKGDYSLGKLTPARSRALDVCVAVSIYADIMERTRGKEWPTAYSEGMLLVYPEIKKIPEVYEAITTMD